MTKPIGSFEQPNQNLSLDYSDSLPSNVNEKWSTIIAMMNSPCDQFCAKNWHQLPSNHNGEISSKVNCLFSCIDLQGVLHNQ